MSHSRVRLYRPRVLLGALASLLALVVGSAHAEEDRLTLGKKLATEGNPKGVVACKTCHGEDGAGLAGANFPRLAGLDAAYLEQQIKHFQAKQRKNDLMSPVAAALTDAERGAVSEYYASLRTKSNAVADASLVARGKTLAQHGAWDREIPPCESCHGPGGVGVGVNFPALAGQHPSYTEAQLAQWKSGERIGEPLKLMSGIAARMTEEDMRAAAAYFASLPVEDSQ
ncbi:MAG: c-type cytochrome [Polyangiaceae bacterium]|nr:c-type cytochrome [Polyangiaceae bacterium]